MVKQMFSKLNIVVLYEILHFSKMYDTICDQIYLVNIAYFVAKMWFLTENFLTLINRYFDGEIIWVGDLQGKLV